MKTMLRIVVLGIILSIINCLSVAQQQYRVVGYYPNWASNLLSPSIKYQELTHINYSFAGINANGSISGILDTGLIGKAHRFGCKVLLSIGGAGSNTTFSPMAADTGKRKTFVSSLTSYITLHHYDGADFDWESPMTSADSVTELALMKQTHDAFQAADTTLLMTMAIGSSPYTGAYRNFAILNQLVNWYNVMTYDLDQGWSGRSGYNAALYYDNIGQDYSVDASMTYLSSGRSPLIPKDKIVIGVPFYGKEFNSATFNSTFTAETTPLFSQIFNMIQSGGWTYHWDDRAKVPYLTNGSSVITYDDSLAIAGKSQYMKSNGFGGVMIWEISQDVVGTSQPLLDVIWNQLNTPVNVVENPSSEQISKYRLFNNFPNPFNPSTTIKFIIPQSAHVSLKIFDLLGREVATLIDEERPAGAGSAAFDASAAGLSSGVYFYRLVSGTFTQTKKCVLVR